MIALPPRRAALGMAAVLAATVATAVLAGSVSFTQFTSINLGGDTAPTLEQRREEPA